MNTPWHICAWQGSFATVGSSFPFKISNRLKTILMDNCCIKHSHTKYLVFSFFWCSVGSLSGLWEFGRCSLLLVHLSCFCFFKIHRCSLDLSTFSTEFFSFLLLELLISQLNYESVEVSCHTTSLFIVQKWLKVIYYWKEGHKGMYMLNLQVLSTVFGF